MNITTPQDEVRRLRQQLEEERNNFRAKRRSYTIALLLMLMLIIGLTIGVVHSLKLRTDIRDTKKHDAKQAEKIEELRETNETRDYQLGEMRQSQAELEEQLTRIRTERDSLRYQLLRHAGPDEYTVMNEEDEGAFSYYRKGGQFLPTDSWYANGYELYVYLRVGDYALTDYGFFRMSDIQGK